MSNLGFSLTDPTSSLYFDHDKYREVTSVEIEGCTYDVIYNQAGNTFEAIEITLTNDEFPYDPPQFEGQELYDMVEYILQERFENEEI